MDRYKEVRANGRVKGAVCYFKSAGKMQYIPLTVDYRPIGPSQPSMEAAVKMVGAYTEEDEGQE